MNYFNFIVRYMYLNDYALYDNKSCADEDPSQCKGYLDAKITLTYAEIGYGEWGESRHFFQKTN